MKQWKPKFGDRHCAVAAVFKDHHNLDHYKYFTLFRTKSLALKALKDIKKVLKEAKHG